MMFAFCPHLSAGKIRTENADMRIKNAMLFHEYS